jgi:hypothetical protein
MIVKLKDIDEPTKTKFAVVHFVPLHYLMNARLWPFGLLESLLKARAWSDYYVLEDKLKHVPFAVSDSVEELHVHADLNGMKLSECSEESLI